MTISNLAPLLQGFFTQRLMQQRRVSPYTITSYRDTFRQFLKFTQQRLHKPPSALSFEEIDAPLVVAFLDHLEKHQGLSVRSRNLRLTAIHSFFRYAAFELPTYSAQIQRVLAIPSKRFTRKLVRFLIREEVDALLAAPDRRTWFGRRDHAFILMAVQTGLRLSEITGSKREDVVLGTGAHVRVIARVCPSFKGKRVTVHLLRHTMAMELLQAGVDRAVIALWLGHESVETTQIYLEATLATKEQALAKTSPPHGKVGRYPGGSAPGRGLGRSPGCSTGLCHRFEGTQAAFPSRSA
jgi:site-specific recombinase XerD